MTVNELIRMLQRLKKRMPCAATMHVSAESGWVNGVGIATDMKTGEAIVWCLNREPPGGADEIVSTQTLDDGRVD